MRLSKNKEVNLLLKIIGEEKVQCFDDFISSVLKQHFIEFTEEFQIDVFFQDYLENFYKNHSLEEFELLRSYTGIDFRNLNAILRDNWNYEYNGKMTPEKKEEYLILAQAISQIIDKAGDSLNSFKAYRGTNISSFRSYGITTLKQLESLKGDYYFDKGFTSTSLLKSQSFFNRPLEWHEECNIEIEYLIPEGVAAIPLITNELSYSKTQTEYLLNRNNLSKITDVCVKPEENIAYITMAVIPEYIWNNVLVQKAYDKSNEKVI